jgi:hypothetical protein
MPEDVRIDLHGLNHPFAYYIERNEIKKEEEKTELFYKN